MILLSLLNLILAFGLSGSDEWPAAILTVFGCLGFLWHFWETHLSFDEQWHKDRERFHFDSFAADVAFLAYARQIFRTRYMRQHNPTDPINE